MTIPDDLHQAVARCPRCLDHGSVERYGNRGDRRWFCTACDLLFAGTQGEAEAEARRRHEKAEHEAQRARRRA